MTDPILYLLAGAYGVALLEAAAALVLAYGIYHLLCLKAEIKGKLARLKSAQRKASRGREIQAEHLLIPFLFYLDATHQDGALYCYITQVYGPVFAEMFCREIADERVRLCMEANSETEKVPTMGEL